MEASPSGMSEGNPSPTIPSLTPRSRPTSRAATSCASSRFPMPVNIEDEDEFNEDEEIGIGDLPPPSTTPSQPRNTRKRSWTWEHFTRIPGNPENPQASCHHCGQLCKCHSKKQGTAVLIAHLQGCQRYKMSKGEAGPATDQTKLSYKASTTTDVDKRGFRKFVKTIEPRFPLPSRYTVMRDSHYIDSEWQLRKRIIGFKEIIDHKGASIGALMDDCLKDWGIQKRNTSMKADVIRNHEFIHVRCCAHILNLIVSEGLKEVDDSIIRVRNIVRYVRASPQRLSKFKAIASQLGISCSKTLCLDVPTRWNSTYLMLDVAQKYQAAFERMEVEDGALNELSELHYHLQEGCTGSCGLLSAFSTGGRVLDSYRSLLSPSTVEALVCTQNWLSDTPIGLDTIGFDADSYKLESGNFV
ncbi:zinc finger BED domain-containing protein RICESLEEPER 3-like [Carya illinoinensis]|uniref:zinc finger BED domain-containing protein RICESLEEPER 3-like n=1 Tax=Carya illinoinensis TaxID=32201 RepID=UPI001C719CF8|nr:zinc finger BED domain-containing protein RICESLEEPER 3-like [Carya illinoinensis]